MLTYWASRTILGMATGPLSGRERPGNGPGTRRGYWRPRVAANRKDGVVPEMVQAIRHQVSVMAVPSVRKACPPTALAAVNVSRVVADVNPELSSDSTRAVMDGVVPATDSTCRAAYIRFPARTAPSSSGVPVPVAVRGVPGRCIMTPRTRGQLLFAVPVQGATSPAAAERL